MLIGTYWRNSQAYEGREVLKLLYLPRAWENEFEDYKKNELKNNANLYDTITIMQFEAIKEYFRWRSKKRLKEITKNTRLERLPEKAALFASRYGDADDWEYDGCVDTGYFGGGMCDLGHTLRYEHYAYSNSTGRTIIFGSKCVSDFFGLEPKKIRDINKVQAEVLEEVKLIIFILETGKHKEYINKFYKDLLEIVKALKPNVNKYFGADWNEQMADFLSVGLPLTPSMISRINWVKNRYYTSAVRVIKVKSLFDDEVILNALDNLGSDPYTYAGRMVLHMLESEESAIKYKLDTDKKRKLMVIIGLKAEDIYRKFTADRDSNLKLAISNAYSNNLSLTDRSKVDRLDLVINGGYAGNRITEYGEVIVNNAKEIADAIDWANNGGLEGFRENNPELDDMMDYIIDNYPENSSNWTIKTAFNIINSYKSRPFKLTVKQSDTVSTAYYLIRHAQLNRDKDGVTAVYSEYKKRYSDNLHKIELIEDYADKNDKTKIKNLDFTLKIIGTVKSSKRLSEKQLKYIDESFGLIKNEISKNEKEVDVKGENKVVEEPKIKDSDIKEIKNGNIGIRVPTITEMSGILGQGLLKEEEE